MSKYILTIDQGTTSSRAILFNEYGRAVCTRQMEFKQIMPESGWVLHNPDEIYLSVMEVIKSVLNAANIKASDLDSIGITNQRETTVIWDKDNYQAIYPAIVWQSRQSEEICNDLIASGHLEMIRKKTGLLINPYFSASKIKWIFDHVDGAKEKAHQGKLLAGTIDTYLLYRLTHGKSFKTDYTNASRTMLFNINDLCWDDDLLNLFEIPKGMMAEVCDSSSYFGDAIIDGIKVPVCSMIGDQQASLFGHTAFEKGDCKITYGTGAFMLINTKEEKIFSDKGLLTTIAYKIGDDLCYALEGSVFVAGSAVQCLRDGLKIINHSSETEDYAQLVKDSLGVYFVPAFVGMGTPYWNNECRGAIFGLSRGTSKEHLIRATLEGIAYQAYDVLEVMADDAHHEINTIGVDGGAASNNFLLQFQADIINTRLIRPKELETTALGAAYLAGLYTGYYQDLETIKKYHEVDQMFLPTIDAKLRAKLVNGWKNAINATLAFKGE